MTPQLEYDLCVLARHALAENNYALARSCTEPLALREALARFKSCNAAIAELKRELSFIARFTDEASLNVLITGETGTGKELLASALGTCSRGRFIAINCAAMPADLIESELFGYRRGAFTGANEDRVGLIQTAQNGTLFLDEVGDMPLAAQAKLLRVMTTRKIRRVGDTAELPYEINCRFVAATHRDLTALIKHEVFREDLYWRLAQWTIHIPPLRERRADIREIIHSIDGWELLSEDTLHKLCEVGDYPGNARELYSRVTQLVLLEKMKRLYNA